MVGKGGDGGTQQDTDDAATNVACAEEFARHGPDEARVEDIARRAGVSKGAFYLHFHTKHDAFEVILQRFFGAMEEHARRRAALEGEAERLAADGAPAAKVLEREARADVELLELLWRERSTPEAAGPRPRGG